MENIIFISQNGNFYIKKTDIYGAAKISDKDFQIVVNKLSEDLCDGKDIHKQYRINKGKCLHEEKFAFINMYKIIGEEYVKNIRINDLQQLKFFNKEKFILLIEDIFIDDCVIINEGVDDDTNNNFIIFSIDNRFITVKYHKETNEIINITVSYSI